jgi:hypothetical protein
VQTAVEGVVMKKNQSGLLCKAKLVLSNNAYVVDPDKNRNDPQHPLIWARQRRLMVQRFALAPIGRQLLKTFHFNFLTSERLMLIGRRQVNTRNFWFAAFYPLSITYDYCCRFCGIFFIPLYREGPSPTKLKIEFFHLFDRLRFRWYDFLI